MTQDGVSGGEVEVEVWHHVLLEKFGARERLTFPPRLTNSARAGIEKVAGFQVAADFSASVRIAEKIAEHLDELCTYGREKHGSNILALAYLDVQAPPGL